MIRHLKCKIFGFNVHQSSHNLLKETWGTTQWTHLLHDWFWHVIGSRNEVLNGNKNKDIQQRVWMRKKESFAAFLLGKVFGFFNLRFLHLIAKQQNWMKINNLKTFFNKMKNSYSSYVWNHCSKSKMISLEHNNIRIFNL